MIPAELIAAVEQVRTRFLRALELLGGSESVRSLLPGSEPLRSALHEAGRVAAHPRLRQPCDGRIVCAVVGASGHGKTTILNELFPDLARRGWLVTEKNDTTAQSLRIEYAADPRDSERVTVHSWDLDQVKLLVGSPGAREQNERENIQVHYNDQDGAVVVDGNDARFAKADLKQFRFGRKQELRPLAAPYEVPAEKREDREFIRALTIKELPGKLSDRPVLTEAGQAFNALQLRAVVKDVTLRDPYTRLGALCGKAPADLKDLVFVDTPGLATASSLKDEVLRHCLEQKSNRIAVELWKEAELDVIVHLVLCGEQSNFATLWKSIEGECGPDAVRDLEERLILLVNGPNLYFENADLNKKFRNPEVARAEGDHFATTLVDNILQKMSPRGRVRPARVCFVDSKRVVEGGFLASNYERKYQGFREAMLAWAAPGGVGRETLDELGLVDDFRANVDALCDPDDRGQGVLVRQIVELARTRGPALLLKKNLVRTGLLDVLRELRQVLGRYYGPDGSLSREAVSETLRTCLDFLDRDDPRAIDEFAAAEVDPGIASLLNGQENGAAAGRWAETSFRKMAALVRDGILRRARVEPGVAEAFGVYFGEFVDAWAERWGYAGAVLAKPSRQSPSTADLLTHCLKLHAREVVYQLGSEALTEGAAAAFIQDEADKARVREAIGLIDRAAREADEACALEKVGR